MSSISQVFSADPWIYFPPLAEGTVKVYQGLEGGMKVEERVSRVSKEKSNIRFETTSRIQYINRPEVVNVTVYALQEDGKVYKVTTSSSYSGSVHRFDPPLLILSFPLTEGKTWGYRDGVTRVTYEVTGFKEIQFPAGQFRAAVLKKTSVFDFTTRKETQVEEEYYAPAVGFLGNRLYSNGEWVWAKRLVAFQKNGKGGHRDERDH